MSDAAAATPAMAQYLAAKHKHPDALVFFRMGDFYELFFDDAKTASRALGLTLTSRSKGQDAVPMAGVPVRAVDGYLRRLVTAGFRVAVCEQMQDPREAAGVIDRQVVRVVTPGTLTEEALLDGKRSNHLAAVVTHKGHAGLAWVELSTGAFLLTECREERLGDELARIEPAELLVAEDAGDLAERLRGSGAAITRRAPFAFGHDGAVLALQRFFGVGTLEGFGVADLRLGVGAAGALIGYLQETQLQALPHVQKLARFDRGQRMLIDRATRASLELVATMREGDGTPLLAVIDRTHTPMGARRLREWLLAPLCELTAIDERQAAVAELVESPALAAELRAGLRGIQDLERLAGRIACGRCNARDLVGLAQSLRPLPALQQALAAAHGDALVRIGTGIDRLEDVAGWIAATLVDDPPPTIKDGGLIRPGHDAELDELIALGRDAQQWMARYQQQEIERTGIQNLRVSFNRVFGYYLEVTHGHREVPLPADYVRKQTTKNAERYVTDELKAFETRALRAEELGKEREQELFTRLRARVAEQTARLQASAALVAELDVLVGFAALAQERSYTRPRVDDSRALRIEDGRHPVLEATHAAGAFVPNDTDLDPPQRRLAVITGPNMAGKSTFIRQNALIVLLAQIGSFVPARSAHIGVVDRVFTRVGAADDISRGASTFMVEMVETSSILNHATPRSLVILDEVGRGTSTYDGLSLAWAIAEDLHDRIGCRALFATHYHQLQDLAAAGNGVVNLRVAVREWGDEIVFLHRLEPGGTDRSYGLHVARLAGIPKTVIERARAILEELETEGEVVKQALAETPKQEAKPKQKPLFETPRERVLRELAQCDPESLTPIQALARLAELRDLLRRG